MASKRSEDFSGPLASTPKRIKIKSADKYQTPGLTPEKQTSTANENEDDDPPSPTNNLRPKRKGSEIRVLDIVQHPKWVGNIDETQWRPLTPFVKQLVCAKGDPLVMLLFGTLSMSICGIYGDFVRQFRDSLTKANMKWTLRIPTEYVKYLLNTVLSIK
ncbi:hypothetical protein BC833DRAFT_661167 [Globomyces pollinis-pini]|nr:hypothetical protein BC833DRAFT_661167 [Globomyces pollinis-pini]